MRVWVLARGHLMKAFFGLLLMCAVFQSAALYGAPVWQTGAYDPSVWKPLAGEHLLRGLSPEMTGTFYTENGKPLVASAAGLGKLTDGSVPGSACDYSQIVGITAGVTLAWRFDEPKCVEQIRISSRWGDSGRDGIGVSSVQVLRTQSSSWVTLSVPSVSYNLGGSSGNWTGTGASFATLADVATGSLATDVVGLKLVFGPQDNNGAGYVEVEATGSCSTVEPALTAVVSGVESTRASFAAVMHWPGRDVETADVCLAFGLADEPLPAPVRVGTVPAKGRVYVPKVDLTPGRTYAYSLFASNSLGRVSERFNGLFTTPTAALQPVRVNEVVAADDVDWFEIFNPNSVPQDLTGWYVTDDPSKKLSKWKTLPEGTSVPAHGYLVVYADGVTGWTDGDVHVDLGLSSDGESVALAQPDGTVVTTLEFPEQIEGASYGCPSDGAAEALRYLQPPTPGAANGEGRNGPTPPLVFSEPHGYKTAPFLLTITNLENSAAQIFYTTDGTAPTPASLRYTGPIRIAATTAIRACAVDPLSVQPRESVATYIFLDDVLSQAPSTTSPGHGFPSSKQVNNQAMVYGMRTDLVNDATARAKILRGFTNSVATISILIDPQNLFNASTGIYVNISQRGETWERAGMVEQIDPVRGATNEFFAPMGLRMRGAASRNAGYPKHSFRLFFRQAYGKKHVNFPFFGAEGVDTFKRMDLRCSQNYSWANNPDEAKAGFLRDAFVTETFERDAQRDLGEPYTRSRYYNLFINGIYWGLYQTQERADDHFAESYLGGTSEDYDTYNVNDLNSGTDEGRQALYNLMMNGFASNEAYQRVQGRNPDGTRNEAYPVYLDVTNLITRTLIGHYTADGDSPCSVWGGRPNNYFAIWNHTANSTGFKWFCHDGEHALGMGVVHGAGEVESNPVGWGVYSGLGNFNSHWLNARLMQNAEYRQVFADLFYRHFFRDGAMSMTNNIRRFRARMAEIDDVIVCEAARWGRAGQTYATWTTACEYIISNFIERRLPYLLSHYRAAGWYPSIDAPKLSLVEEGARAELVSTAGATIYYACAGTDPRLWGGTVNAAATAYTAPLATTRTGFTVWARARSSSGEWSALAEIEVPGYQPVELVAKMNEEESQLEIAYAHLPRAAHLFLAWGASDQGASLTNWSTRVDLGEVAAGSGACRVGAPAGYDPNSPLCACVRCFLAVETVVGGYESLAYVRGDGSQRVPLDYSPTEQTRCQIKFAFDVGCGGVFVGTDKGNDSTDWRFFSNKDKDATKNTYLDFPAGSAARLLAPIVADSTTVYDFEFGNFYLKDLVSNTLLLQGNPITFPSGYSNSTYLFSTTAQGSYSYGTVYALKFYEGQTIRRNYEPARDESGVVCLFETIGAKFYYPVGGVLIAGPSRGRVGGESVRTELAASAALALGGTSWAPGGRTDLSADVEASLRVAEVMSVPVLGGPDGAEYLVLTNLDATTALALGGVRVTCTKSGDTVAKCDFTFPLGTSLAAGGSFVCTKEAFWPDGKITDGSVDVCLFDASGNVVQHLFLTTKGSDAFRMCNGKGGAFVATSFDREVLDESGWRPSIPDIDDKTVRQAVADAIVALPSIQNWLVRLAASETGAAAIRAFRGSSETLAQCYLVAALPETEPDLDLRISSIAYDGTGNLVFGVELRQKGELVVRPLNGRLKLVAFRDLEGEPVSMTDLGTVLPGPSEKLVVPSIPQEGKMFYLLRIAP